MTHVRVRGFKIFTDSGGKLRCYHRQTKLKIDLALAPLGSAAFFAECEKINAVADAMKSRAPKAGTLSALIEAYYREEHFKNLSDRTKADYRKVSAFLDKILDTPAHAIDTPLIAGIHNRAAEKIGWRQANYLRTFLSEVFRHAVPQGLIAANYAEAVIPKPRPRDRARANRPWTIHELGTVLDLAPPHVAAAIALMANTGLDPSDALGLRRDAVTDGVIRADRGKTGQPVAIPVGRRLKAALDAAPVHSAITVLANTRGQPWTYNGFSTVWDRFKGKQVEAGTIPGDLTLKGLRHMVATFLREGGASPREIADLLGQKTESMASWYSRDANLANSNRKTVEALDNEADRRGLNVKLFQKPVKP